MRATSKDGVDVVIKFQSHRATDAEVAVLRLMTASVCHTVSVLDTFKVHDTKSAFVTPCARRGWTGGLSPPVVHERARQLIEVLQSTHRCWQRSPPHLDAV